MEAGRCGRLLLVSSEAVAAERREPVEEPHKARLVPHVVDREQRSMTDEQVERAVTDDPVGDSATGRIGEAGLWDLGHGRIVCQAQPRGARPTDLNCP